MLYRHIFYMLCYICTHTAHTLYTHCTHTLHTLHTHCTLPTARSPLHTHTLHSPHCTHINCSLSLMPYNCIHAAALFLLWTNYLTCYLAMQYIQYIYISAYKCIWYIDNTITALHPSIMSIVARIHEGISALDIRVIWPIRHRLLYLCYYLYIVCVIICILCVLLSVYCLCCYLYIVCVIICLLSVLLFIRYPCY